jgi:hypothetical protein
VRLRVCSWVGWPRPPYDVDAIANAYSQLAMCAFSSAAATSSSALRRSVTPSLNRIAALGRKQERSKTREILLLLVPSESELGVSRDARKSREGEVARPRSGRLPTLLPREGGSAGPV